MTKREKINIIDMVVDMKIGDMFDDIDNKVIIISNPILPPNHKLYGTEVHYNVLVMMGKDETLEFDEYYKVENLNWNEVLSGLNTEWTVDDTNTLKEVLRDIEYQLGDKMRAQDKAMGI